MRVRRGAVIERARYGCRSGTSIAQFGLHEAVEVATTAWLLCIGRGRVREVAFELRPYLVEPEQVIRFTGGVPASVVDAIAAREKATDTVVEHEIRDDVLILAGTLEELERVRRALAETGGDKSKAARLLGTTRETLRAWLARWRRATGLRPT